MTTSEFEQLYADRSRLDAIVPLLGAEARAVLIGVAEALAQFGALHEAHEGSGGRHYRAAVVAEVRDAIANTMGAVVKLLRLERRP